jgi:hypothetical protein
MVGFQLLKARIDTWLTQQKQPETELLDTEKFLLAANQELPLISYQVDEPYLYIKLAEPIHATRNWYVLASTAELAVVSPPLHSVEWSDIIEIQEVRDDICDETCPSPIFDR